MGDAIARVEVFALELPFRHPVQFSASSSTSRRFSLLRIGTRNGVDGIAEITAFPRNGETEPAALAAHVEALRPLLIGADPLEHETLLARLAGAGAWKPAKALIDIALWDIKGKAQGVPVCRLLAGELAASPVTEILFGNTVEAMVAAAAGAASRNIRSLKAKVWQRSLEDVRLIAELRDAAGPDTLLYADANQVYTEAEARAVFPEFAAYGVAMIEDPCKLPPEELAVLAQALPIKILGEIPIVSYAAAERYVNAGAAGAISLHVTRTGFTESLKIAALCAAAGVPALIGTDLESSIGAAVHLHLRAAVPWLQSLPSESQFFEHLAGELVEQPLRVVDGAISMPGRPGFGFDVDAARLRRYAG